jgi:hypothetical protein
MRRSALQAKYKEVESAGATSSKTAYEKLHKLMENTVPALYSDCDPMEQEIVQDIFGGIVDRYSK